MTAESMSYANSKTQIIKVDDLEYAYRITGRHSTRPIVLFNHLAGTIDDWDPRVVDGLAAENKVITFDNLGVGGSSGITPTSVGEMAEDGIKFVRALGLKKVDLLGFSLGGAVAQCVVQNAPDLVRRLILAGTGPAGGIGIDQIPKLAYQMQLRSLLTFTDIRTYLFFTRTENGKSEARKFLGRLKERENDLVDKVSISAFRNQLKAISAFAKEETPSLSEIHHPTFVANGESDIMVPSVNSAHLAAELPNAELALYRDAGHGGVFQYHNDFVSRSLKFLSKDVAPSALPEIERRMT